MNWHVLLFTFMSYIKNLINGWKQEIFKLKIICDQNLTCHYYLKFKKISRNYKNHNVLNLIINECTVSDELMKIEVNFSLIIWIIPMGQAKKSHWAKINFELLSRILGQKWIKAKFFTNKFTSRLTTFNSTLIKTSLRLTTEYQHSMPM